MIPHGITRVDVEIIESFARNGMKIQKVADDVHYDPKTIRYHFSRVHRLTGLNPRDFYDLWAILQLLKGETDGKRTHEYEAPKTHR